MSDSYLTPQQVAERLQVKPVTVYRWIKSRKLGAFRIGHLYRVPEAELQRFIAAGDTRKGRR